MCQVSCRFRPTGNWRHSDRKVATLGIAQCRSIYVQSFSTKFGAIFFYLSFSCFENGFFGICFKCFVNNISEKLKIVRTLSWPISSPRKCWYSGCGATLASPTMRELRTSLALAPRSLTWTLRPTTRWWLACNMIEAHENAAEFHVIQCIQKFFPKLCLI